MGVASASIKLLAISQSASLVSSDTDSKTVVLKEMFSKFSEFTSNFENSDLKKLFLRIINQCVQEQVDC